AKMLHVSAIGVHQTFTNPLALSSVSAKMLHVSAIGVHQTFTNPISLSAVSARMIILFTKRWSVARLVVLTTDHCH
ncbi:MAG: hypothetical protein ABS876_06050, partial [Ruminococcus sp.]